VLRALIILIFSPGSEWATIKKQFLDIPTVMNRSSGERVARVVIRHRQRIGKNRSGIKRHREMRPRAFCDSTLLCRGPRVLTAIYEAARINKTVSV
jgi:hypothetical protein